MKAIYDAVVIGGGIAGLSAALMLGRARRSVLVVDAGSPRNRFATHMHGVPGHEGTPPGELLAKVRQEVSEYGGEFVAAEVDAVVDNDPEIAIILRGGEQVRARAVIAASGLTDELPNIPGLAELWGSRVLHCPYCHGWEVRDQRIGVIAVSPMSLHQIQLLRQWSDQIVAFTADLGPIDTETEARLRARGVELVPTRVQRVEYGAPDKPLTVRTDDGATVELDAIFVAGVGRPHDSYLADFNLERTETPFGNFIAIGRGGSTGHERIWAAGNVVDPSLNVPMSMGAGSFTGAAVNAFLVEKDFEEAL